MPVRKKKEPRGLINAAPYVQPVNLSLLPSLCFIQTASLNASLPAAYSGTEHDERPIYFFTARLAFSTVRSSSTRTSLPSFTTISPFTTV